MNVTKKVLIASIAVALLPSMAMAQPANIPGYAVSTDGKVVKNSYKECWHAGFWTPSMAIAECDPGLIAKVEKPEPKVVVAAAPPAPLVAPTPAPAPVAQKVSFSADALFAFDKAVLKPEGKAELNAFAKNINGVSYESIHVTGHTDRFGSDKYNQKLSEQRATAVKDYLVSQDVAANKIDAVGAGEKNPTTKLGDCAGAKSKKVIACLQPDRRVDVEVTGSK